ncbi:SAV_2336 N-terminal domain-related protein [Actinomadura sp. NEAU-AAG7]|uniref:SAV_2336 N-terminal domain-related protein n=1 Tax=Actinomadura sp. NEAU-AAG7 TaxID=2839640 RepID=UPI002032A790|nr:SAV_2336 N-terminal domain-related protein [Actinomadura sp. NEAU-AAG7]
MASIEDLLAALEALGVRGTDREIAETLWLAERFGPAAPAARRARDPHPPAEPPEPGPPAPPRPPLGEPAGPRPVENRVALHPPEPAPEDAARATGRAVAARAPAVTPLPQGLDILRALRPLKRRFPSAHALVLDEDATADRGADEKVLLPVLVPEPRRWLGLSLVVDTGPSMEVWRPLALELRRLLETLGAFHDIRLWYLRRQPGGGLGLHAGPGAGTAPRSAKQIIDPSGRRLTLVLSDCVGDIWRDGEALTVLDDWGRHGPVALLQPFPQRLWQRTGLNLAPARFNACEAGVPNVRLTVERRGRRPPTGDVPDGRGVPIPVLEIEPEWLAPWARLITANAPGGIDGMVAWTRPVARPAEAEPPGLVVPGDRDAAPEQRVAAFRAASPQAYRLAGYLSTVPLSLPVMRLVQQLTLRDSRPSHLAEVLDSGLLHIVGEAAADPDETRYAFDEGVAEVLQCTIRRSEAVRVIEEVNAFVTARLGQPRATGALLDAPGGDRAFSPSSRPFAEFSADLLGRLGGDYAELARPRVTAAPRKAPRSLVEHVDVVVVGSGFGGSVAAYRLAEAGRSVVLLERGRPYPPGGFPRSPDERDRAFWRPDARQYGLFDIWTFDGGDSIVAAGLGGGSLISANAMLRKDERWFESWPMTRNDLDPHYDAVERMTGATPYPFDRAPFDFTSKTHAMRDAAAELGLDFTLPPLAVSFAREPGATPGLSLPIVNREFPDLHGRPRRTCKLCGECIIGCNEGSKNTLDFTYLSAAAHHGADLRTSHEVKGIRPRPGGGYEVDYVHHVETGRKRPRIQTLSCDRLVLGAGTYGTTFLLLKSRAAFPGLSDALGTRFGGNGDLLTFLQRTRDHSRIRPLDAGRGPVITSAIRVPDGPGGVPGAYIEDGGYPGFVDWLAQPADNEFQRAVKYLVGNLTDLFRREPASRLARELSELIGDGALSAGALPLVGMGDDAADGRLRLERGRLAADWTAEGGEAHFTRLRQTMQRMANVLGAEYADNPAWFRPRILTIHPLGGAPMGLHPGVGVCDAYGEVFGYPGLYIADGAAMPGAVGPNPALTIAAHADRMSTRIAESSPARVLPAAGPDATSLSFTEELRGYFTYGKTEPRAGERSAARERMKVRLSAVIDDTRRFLGEPGQRAPATGRVEIGGQRFAVEGTLTLDSENGTEDSPQLKYRLHGVDGEAAHRTVVILRSASNLSSGQPVRICLDPAEGEDHAQIIGAGILYVEAEDFVRDLMAFRTSGPRGIEAMSRVGSVLYGNLWETYGPTE